MLDILNWIGQDPRHFVGTLVFISVVCWWLVLLIAAVRGGKE